MAVAYYYSSTAGEYTLTGGISSSATSVTVNSVTGLPSTPFKVALDPGLPQEEIVKVTNVAGTTLTVVRGWDGTSAVSHAALAKVRHAMTAEDLRLSREHENATASVHGVGTVVGTSEAQTLTNKNLTSGTNTFPTSLVTLTGTQTLSNKTLNSATFSGDVGTAGGNVSAGDTTISTQRYVEVRRLGTDSQSRQGRMVISSDDLALICFKNGASVNVLTLNDDGSTSVNGSLTVPGAVTAGSVSSSGTITQAGIPVVTTTGSQTLSNKTLSSPALTGTPTVNSVAIPKIASGSLVITIPSGESNKVVSVDLTSYGFSSPPRVIVSPGVSTHFGHSGTVSTTSAQIGATHRDNVTTGGSVNTYWIAVGS